MEYGWRCVYTSIYNIYMRIIAHLRLISWMEAQVTPQDVFTAADELSSCYEFGWRHTFSQKTPYLTMNVHEYTSSVIVHFWWVKYHVWWFKDGLKMV